MGTGLNGLDLSPTFVLVFLGCVLKSDAYFWPSSFFGYLFLKGYFFLLEKYRIFGECLVLLRNKLKLRVFSSQLLVVKVKVDFHLYCLFFSQFAIA